jgi:hypothetical protein
MAQAILLRGGVGGVTSDDVTASKAQVLQGYKTVTTDSDDEIVEGTIPNRGNVVDTVSFENAHWESKFVARMEEGYYSQAGQWKPCVAIPYAVLANVAGIDANKMLDILTVAGVRGTIPVRGYRGPDCTEMFMYQPDGGYVVRIEEGYYHMGGNRQWKPYVLVSPALAKSAVNYHPEKTLSDTRTCEEQGQIKMINTQDSNYRLNKSTAFGIDGWSDRNNPVFWIDFPHGNGYYYRGDGHPHTCIDAVSLGTADANSVLQGQTATSVHGVKFEGAIQRWICTTGDVITALNGEGFAWDDTHASRGRGIVVKIPNGRYIQGANWVFLPSPNLQPWNVRKGVNINGVTGTMEDYSVGRPVFDGATFNTIYVGGVANKDFPEANILRDRSVSVHNYARYAGGTTISLLGSNNYHFFNNYAGFVLDRAILMTFFKQIKVKYRLDVTSNSTNASRSAGVEVFVGLYNAANRRQILANASKEHRYYQAQIYDGGVYEFVIDTSAINTDVFIALCAVPFSDYNGASIAGNVTFTDIELIN